MTYIDTGKKYADELLDAQNLDELAAICARIAEESEEIQQDLEDRRIYTFLPTFSDNGPADLESVWSWDEKRVLVGSTIPFKIESRYDVGE